MMPGFATSLSLVDCLVHLAGNMNDRWQIAKTRKLNHQIAASGERQQCVLKSQPTLSEAGSQN